MQKEKAVTTTATKIHHSEKQEQSRGSKLREEKHQTTRPERNPGRTEAREGR